MEDTQVDNQRLLELLKRVQEHFYVIPDDWQHEDEQERILDEIKGIINGNNIKTT